MKKGTTHTLEARLKIKEARKRQGSNVWNKGLITRKYDELSCKRKRRDKTYYLNELKQNAKRSFKKQYYAHNAKRKEELKEKAQYYNEITGCGRPRRDWTEEEVRWLIDNQKEPHLEICKKLERSWASIQHKISRLGLQKYNKWN